jgi:Polyketide cyclase / dehydrase and lipid transport
VAVPIRLVCIPSSDIDFAGYARAALAALQPAASRDALRTTFEKRLRERYPAATVRPQEGLATLGPREGTVWYVSNRPFQSRITASMEVPAPQELVYHIYVERWPEWQTGVELRLRGPRTPLIGREYSATYKIVGRTFEGIFRIVDADPPRSVRVEAIGVGGIRVWYATTFRPSARGTAVEVLGDFDVPAALLPGLQRLVLERLINVDIERSHAALADLCEREARNAPAE